MMDNKQQGKQGTPTPKPQYDKRDYGRAPESSVKIPAPPPKKSKK